MNRHIKYYLLAALLFVCANINMMSCSDHDGGANDKPTPYSGIPLVILDTDIGSSTDDLLAMEMLTDTWTKDAATCWA